MRASKKVLPRLLLMGIFFITLLDAKTCMTEEQWKGVVGFVPPGAKPDTIKRTFGEDNKDFTMVKVLCTGSDKPGSKTADYRSTNPLKKAVAGMSGERCAAVLEFLISYTKANNSSANERFNNTNSDRLRDAKEGEDNCQISLGAAVDAITEHVSEDELKNLADYIKANRTLSVAAYNAKPKTQSASSSTAH